MKKYIKPDFVYENFELSQNIAVCGWDMSNHNDASTCTAEGDETFGLFGGVTIFTGDHCEMNIGEDAEIYCYETSSDDYKVFNS